MVIHMLEIFSGNAPKIWDADFCFPENSLHPDEQVKMAEEIVKKAKDKNITVITYSPVMVEAFNVYSKKHNVDFQAYYCDDFIGEETFKVHRTDLWIIYQNLGKAFETISLLDIQLEFKL